MKRNIMFICIVLLQICFLAGLICYHVPKIKAGTLVLLETEPVDPFSVFRGRYVTLNYKISNIASGLLRDCRIDNLKRGESVYVLLEKEKDGFWRPCAVYHNKPNSIEGVFLKGKIGYMPGESLHLEYGMESFFLSEKSADEIEGKMSEFRRADWDEIREQRKVYPLSVVVSVTKNGQGYSVRLFWEGKEYR